MIEIDVVQGSPEWFEARSGVITASEARRIITPTGAPSHQINALRNQLMAELCTGQPVAFTKSDWMRRGTELEPEARIAAQLLLDREIFPCGFVYESESRLVGCSPDGRYGEPGDYSAGGVEIKCPSPIVHIDYLLGDELPEEYRPQVQFSMMVTGAPSWDFISYHPGLPTLHVQVARDDEFIGLLRTLCLQLQQRMTAAFKRLRELGHVLEE